MHGYMHVCYTKVMVMCKVYVAIHVWFSVTHTVFNNYCTCSACHFHFLSREMSSSIAKALLVTQLILIVRGEEKSVVWDSYGPYKQVYPDADIQQDPRNCSVSENSTCPLFIALMMAFGGDYVSSGVIPGIQVAIDEINNDPSMLPGYTLHYTLMATRVGQLTSYRLEYVPPHAGELQCMK